MGKSYQISGDSNINNLRKNLVSFLTAWERESFWVWYGRDFRDSVFLVIKILIFVHPSFHPSMHTSNHLPILPSFFSFSVSFVSLLSSFLAACEEDFWWFASEGLMTTEPTWVHHCRSWKGAMFTGGYVHRGLCSQGVMFTGSYVHRGLCSQGAVFTGGFVHRELCSQGLCSQGAVFTGSYVHKELCSQGAVFTGGFVHRELCSQGVMFIGGYVHRGLCSQGVMFTGGCVHRGLCSQEVMFTGGCVVVVLHNPTRRYFQVPSSSCGIIWHCDPVKGQRKVKGSRLEKIIKRQQFRLMWRTVQWPPGGPTVVYWQRGQPTVRVAHKI